TWLSSSRVNGTRKNAHAGLYDCWLRYFAKVSFCTSVLDTDVVDFCSPEARDSNEDGRGALGMMLVPERREGRIPAATNVAGVGTSGGATNGWMGRLKFSSQRCGKAELRASGPYS